MQCDSNIEDLNIAGDQNDTEYVNYGPKKSYGMFTLCPPKVTYTQIKPNFPDIFQTVS